MGRPVIDHGSAAIPSVKFTTEGGYVIGALINVDDRQETDFGSGEPLFWPSGDPKMQKRVRLVRMRHKHVEFSGTDPLPAVVAVWVNGPKMREYQAALAAYRQMHSADPTVGTVLRVLFSGTEPAATRGFHPRKVLAFTFRPEEERDRSAADKAEAEFRADTAAAPARPPVAHRDPDSGDVDDDGFETGPTRNPPAQEHVTAAPVSSYDPDEEPF